MPMITTAAAANPTLIQRLLPRESAGLRRADFGTAALAGAPVFAGTAALDGEGAAALTGAVTLAGGAAWAGTATLAAGVALAGAAILAGLTAFLARFGQRSVGKPGHADHAASAPPLAVPGDCSHALAGQDVPQSRRLVEAAGDGVYAVGREGDAQDGRRADQ